MVKIFVVFEYQSYYPHLNPLSPRIRKQSRKGTLQTNTCPENNWIRKQTSCKRTG